MWVWLSSLSVSTQADAKNTHTQFHKTKFPYTNYTEYFLPLIDLKNAERFDYSVRLAFPKSFYEKENLDHGPVRQASKKNA